MHNKTRDPLEFPLIGKLFWHDGRAFKLFKSSPRDKKQYLYYVAPSTAEEKVSGTGPVTFTTDMLQSVVVDHLRSQLRDPHKWLSVLIEKSKENPKPEEAVIVQALKKLDDDWPLSTPQSQAHTLFTLVERVNVFPDQLGISFNWPAVLNLVLVKEMVQSSVVRHA